MAKYLVTSFNVAGDEEHFEVVADDPAAALGIVLDEYGDSTAHGAPMLVERVAAPARRRQGRRKRSGAGDKGSKVARAVPTAAMGAVSTKTVPAPVQDLLQKVADDTGCTAEQ